MLSFAEGIELLFEGYVEVSRPGKLTGKIRLLLS